ncbi:glucose-6-phosphate isomerase [Jiangella aurantiaca]|uniref:glucose-6-phosphate isomerase n=1 Tax=Jiangella aurantiaca TaxID=2530373 RepID=A0A4R5A1E5_9ACTN|nr:glucose-6-phosphate isomerase family protein [Jiangella aurantiaca]TDD65563.1 glucose-6-phosphate isomerase [Jiangella aurantiaca]
MDPKLDPFTTLLDLKLGTFDPERGPVQVRTQEDLRGFFQADPPRPDELVYRVMPVPVPTENSEIQCSTTVLEPGTVGDEYYMTKGHFHAVRDRSEIYIGLAGEGCLVLATEDGRHRVEPIREGMVNYVPGGWAHRSVNVGDEPLVFFAAYVGDAGHDYATIERDGFPVLVCRGDDGPVVTDNPHYRP